ncbi:tetraacyldisaccharide 4'-kinase [Marinobacter salicampi]|uniref:tetraacyldisaccharide 4'-kinase n=1 Tax=Marinobacter salicampi TaxID=435907 RepID=UPI0014096744|nr:tetraacyldisaccharide 4'-kinase [Marinobacter salicampi]
MTGWLDHLWYGSARPLWPLWPLAWIYRWVARRRRDTAISARGALSPLAAPVIVVGNITAGGTGKSPLTAWIVAELKSEGWRPVILTRGYGGRSSTYPLLVKPDTPVSTSGDEPLMLARQSSCPVVVDPRRSRSARWALAQDLGDILVCDDGLQHYALARDLEIAVFDGQRGLGNGAPIPVGPLREPPERLDDVDFVVGNGRWVAGIQHAEQYTMVLSPTVLRHVKSGETRPVDWLLDRHVRAVAGIGNPERFFQTLRGLGARVRPLALPDHHRFGAGDLAVQPGEQLVMTAKDAVKCQGIAHDHCWVLDVTACLPGRFREVFMARVTEIQSRT